MPDIVLTLGILIVLFGLGTFLSTGQRNLVVQVCQIMTDRKLDKKYPDNRGILEKHAQNYSLGIIFCFFACFINVLVLAAAKTAELYPTFTGSALLAAFNAFCLVYLYNMAESWKNITPILEQMDIIPRHEDEEE